MTRKISLFAVLVIIAVGVAAQMTLLKGDELPISIQVQVVDGTNYSTKNLPVNVIFRNTSDGAIRLLDVFDDSKLKSSFFVAKINDVNGTPIDTIGGGKISLSKDAMQYVVLKKDESHVVRLDLTNFLPGDFKLRPGSYFVSVIYQNQYGEDCFKGKVESNAINLTITE